MPFKVLFTRADMWGMVPRVDMCTPVAPSGSDAVVPLTAEQRLALFSDLARVVTWEFDPRGAGIRWHTPLARLIGDDPTPGSYWLSSGPAGRSRNGQSVRPVAPDDLGDALLAPVIEGARAGMGWDSYELLQEMVAPSGQPTRLLVRAMSVSGGPEGHLFGIVGEPEPADGTPWISADTAERLQLLVEHSPSGIVVHQDGKLVYANASAIKMTGYRTLQEGVGQPITAFLHPDHVGPTVARLSQLFHSGDVVKGHEALILHSDGTEVPVEVTSARTTWGGKPAFQVILHDITERKAAEEANRALLAVERRYAAAVAALEEGVLVLDRDGSVQAANESAVRILGPRLQRGRGDAVLTGGGIVWGVDGGAIAAEDLPVARALKRQITRSHAVLGVVGDGGVRQWLSVNTRRLDDDQSVDGAVVVCSVSDITDRKQLMDRLAWEARNDVLTGLLNRTGLLARIGETVADPDLVGDTVLLVIDIDRFKMVNDSLGHAAGDEVLRSVAHRLADAVPPTAAVGRLHGDGFAVLLTGVVDTDGAVAWAETLRAALARPLRLASGRILNLGVSAGVVRAGPLERDAGRLLQDADLAMLEAKARHRGRVALFDAGLRDEIGGRLELEHDLRAAVANGELRVEYQPVASLADGRVVGLEALVRWEHPSRGLLMPARFIGLAEESELIVTLGSWVLVQSFSQMARWRARHRGAEDAFLAVNVSPRQLEGPDLVPAVDEALRRSGLSPSAVVLEITESGFIADDPHIARVLDDLRGAGLRLAVDDFGAGYSSLSQLKRLPVSFLKIDRAFVEGIGTNHQDDHIVSVVTELGHGLGVRVIAEGVETETQRDAVRRLGCDLYQGYLLARPCPSAAVPVFWPDAGGPGKR